jgi:hypothetical protein
VKLVVDMGLSMQEVHLQLAAVSIPCRCGTFAGLHKHEEVGSGEDMTKISVGEIEVDVSRAIR